MDAMTSETTTAPATGPRHVDSFGATLEPGHEVGIVMANKTPGSTFARATVVDAGEQIAFDVHEYRDHDGEVVVQPDVSHSAPPMVAVIGYQSSDFGQKIGLSDVFGATLRAGDHAAYLLWNRAERVALGRGTVTGVQEGMVSLIANGSAAAMVRGDQKALAPATTLFRLSA
jgi:hypothetical protein